MRPFLKFSGRGAACVAMLSTALSATPAATEVCAALTHQGLPERTDAAPGASDVMAGIASLGAAERDGVLVEEVLSGNVPNYFRNLVEVEIAGMVGGEARVLTLCVTPDYLAVGDEVDNVRVPLGLPAAAEIADQTGFMLPTARMVDAIYAEAEVRLAPAPMPPTREMTSTGYFVRHNEMVEGARASMGMGREALTAGHKKDVVISPRLKRKPGRVAIYGWHRPNGKPIQPLSTVHGAAYADYSHGVRLVSRTALLDGEPVALDDILADGSMAGLASSEGPIPNLNDFLRSLYR